MKKAQLGFLQKLILILGGAFVLFAFTTVFYQSMGEASELEKCRTTAMVMDAAREKSSRKILTLDCPMREVKVDYRDVRFDGEVSDEKVFRVFAEELKKLWYAMGEGRFMPYDQKWASLGVAHPCVVYSHISFDDKISDKKKELTGFRDYIRTTEMVDSDKKYADYLKLHEDVEDTQMVNENDRFLFEGRKTEHKLYKSDSVFPATDRIDLSKEYYVIYKLDLHSIATQKVDKNKVFLYAMAADEIGDAGCDYIANEVR